MSVTSEIVVLVINYTARIILVVGLICLWSIYLPINVLALNPQKHISQFGLDSWKEELPQTTIVSLIQTRNGYIYFSTYEGLVRFDGVRFTTIESLNAFSLNGKAIYDIYEDRSDRLWLATATGLFCLDNGQAI